MCRGSCCGPPFVRRLSFEVAMELAQMVARLERKAEELKRLADRALAEGRTEDYEAYMVAWNNAVNLREYLEGVKTSFEEAEK